MILRPSWTLAFALWPVVSTLTVVNEETTLECHRRPYQFHIERKDDSGNRCWGDITAMACWGRCDSGEIADWRFPYKKSYHPVCTYDTQRLRATTLVDCNSDLRADDPLRIYEYYDALSCSCQTCDSTSTSCEGYRDP